MYYYNVEHFAILMALQFNIFIDEEQVEEEKMILYKEELDDEFVSNKLLDTTPKKALMHSCNYSD
ncbi:hypothetical protein [Alkalicoccobacillus plakortidis]|uniref:Uncharacterized protein n=1 Tax=Alkalicoccobacillus plakortidis TaxID=444060 RepID=A0ABT0XKH8_9BACI|nr:hypothetical protein [Alkalicoccobacillus plakortidis]MCM2676415.1 hypothetical protein [Alkalicoccobacillus plakortidis]